MEIAKSRRNSYLDTLRGIAVISVVSVHCFQVAGAEYSLTQKSSMQSFGQYGVELFFMISGCLMYMLYGQEREFSLKVFARRRLARIFPLWALFVAVGSAISLTKISPFFGAVTNSERFSNHFSFLLSLVLGLTFTLWIFGPYWNSVVPGGWSIQCEFYNYVLFALLRKLSLRKLILITSALNVGLNLISSIEQLTEFPILLGAIRALNRLNVVNSFSYFLLGILCLRLYNNVSIYGGQNYRKQSRLTDKVTVSVFLLSILFTPIAFGNQAHCMIYILTCLILCGAIQKIKSLASILIKLGKYSYSIYFTHFYLLSVIYALKPRFLFHPSISVNFSWILVTVITISMTYFIGKISWTFYEYPIKRFFH